MRDVAIELKQRPGELARVASTLARHHVTLKAGTALAVGTRLVARFVPSDIEAARRALDAAGNPPVDFLILATCTPDHTFPSTAPAVASRLGLGTIAAFDLNAACSGFVYGLSAGAGMLASGVYGTGLIIGSVFWSLSNTAESISHRLTLLFFAVLFNALAASFEVREKSLVLTSHSELSFSFLWPSAIDIGVDVDPLRFL